MLHADANEESFALRRQGLDDIRALPNGKIYVWSEQGAEGTLEVDGRFAGMMDITAVGLPADATYHLCGPLPFLQAVRSALINRGINPRDIQYEVFGPDLWQADAEV